MNETWQQLQESQDFQSLLFTRIHIPFVLWNEIFIYQGVSAQDIRFQRWKEEHQWSWKDVMHELKIDTDWWRIALFDDSNFDHWAVNPNDRQMQAVFCHRCGNYAISNTLSRHDRTFCSHW